MLKITIDETLKRLTENGGNYIGLFDKGALDVGIYRPIKTDSQKPHTRDEVYLIASGSGGFVCDGKTESFGPGDLLFVPAGVEHRFVDFTDDFSTWVIFSELKAV